MNFVGRARRVPLAEGQNSGAVATVAVSMAAAATVEQDVDYDVNYDDEGQVALDQPQGQPPPHAPGRPHGYIRNGRAAPPPQVRDHDHLPKLKLNIPTFEDRYVPDIYLTWELETEQRFTCLQFPEDRLLLLLFVHSLVVLVFGGLNIVEYIMIISLLLGLL